MKRWIIRRLEPGVRLPRGWGHAWREPSYEGTVVMPVPLNLVAAYARRVYEWLRWGLDDSRYVRALRKAYLDGVSDGRNGRYGAR